MRLENRPSTDGSLFGDDTDGEELPTLEELLFQEPPGHSQGIVTFLVFMICSNSM
jgi:hypothetical protein